MTHSVYSMMDGDGVLLYVGYTSRSFVRLSEHLSGAEWADDVISVGIERFEVKADALRREAELIRDGKPLHNIARPMPKQPLHTDKVVDDICQRIWHCGVWKPSHKLKLIAEVRLLPTSDADVRRCFGSPVNNMEPF